ncbi:head decoration protein [Agrobacterium sp. CMT1]|uniref:head decoration protein n=1 Tax=Agrobacterium sp. CMT1 TaxID=3128901 RepID=UPI00307824F4
MQKISYKTESDVVKDEGKNRFSRDTDTLAQSGKVICGAVLGKVTNTGKFKQLDTAANDGTQIAAAIILQNADASAADIEVVTLKRRAQVVLQSLTWPAGITAAQQKIAIDQLAALGIIARRGV